VIERFFRSTKEEFLRCVLIPLHLADARRHVSFYVSWFNQHRPHQGLAGRTPDEIYFNLAPANEAPRIEPRPHWPTHSPCASPLAPPRVERPEKIELIVSFLGDDKRLPVIELKTAA